MLFRSGEGVPELVERIIERVPPPGGDEKAALRGLVFDAEYDSYRGVIVFVRIVDGSLRRGQHVVFMAGGRRYEIDEVGVFTPAPRALEELTTGEVGYFTAAIKSLGDVRIGDTVTDRAHPAAEALPGYTEPLPMVFCSLYPSDTTDYEQLRRALEKLRLNDSSFTFVPESSGALGLGFRCGFLGLLHMEIVQERLERESGISMVQTAPNVTFEILLRGGEVRRIDNPDDLPDVSQVEEIREPVVRATIMLPAEYIGNIMTLLEERRGKYRRTEYISERRVTLSYDLPLAEIITDFYDKLKSASRGYATLDYELLGYRAEKLVRVSILVGGCAVEALSMICHRDVAEKRGRRLLQKLKGEIPRHLFEVPLQAAIGGRIIARETIPAMRKNVTAKCYGGDITRKRKLLERQKAGKRRMKSVGNVEIPQDAFLAVLRLDEESG